LTEDPPKPDEAGVESPLALPLPLPSPLPLPGLLSQVLVAFTIEFDNEAEHRLAHWTTRTGRSAGRSTGPGGATWLVSQVMWANVLQYVDDDGVMVGDLAERARTSRLSLGGLKRWRYITLDPDSGTGRTGSAGIKVSDETVVRLTAAGRKAGEIWRPLAAEVEGRWRSRFGQEAVVALGESLAAVRDQFDPAVPLPRYLPIVYPTQNGKAEVPVRVNGVAGTSRADGAARGAGAGRSLESGRLVADDLSVLLSQVLLRFTLDFEGESRISLPISANTLRVLEGDGDGVGVRVRDLPALTGVSKEANSMALGFLERHECAVQEPDPSSSRGKVIRLTPKGQKAQAKYRRVLRETEERWAEQFGADAVGDLRASLERVLGDGVLIRQGMRPYPDGWRASVGALATLPLYPMVLHRGGYPDGS
jgi:DNA-binding MarR family transcriptional regulator